MACCCCICLDDENPNRLATLNPCSHRFHSECAIKALAVGNHTCPLCRGPVDTIAHPDGTSTTIRLPAPPTSTMWDRLRAQEAAWEAAGGEGGSSGGTVDTQLFDGYSCGSSERARRYGYSWSESGDEEGEEEQEDELEIDIDMTWDPPYLPAVGCVV